jgi:2-polyprenyl-3-methyl-5-hydroxy-6-metoxy-1,4-benzoquinol methylase
MGKRMNQSQGINPRTKVGVCTTIVRCLDCSLVYANPLPIPHSIDQHYGKPPEEYWKPSYFEVANDYFEDQIDTFLKLYNAEAGLSALDIGAGLGKCMMALEKRQIEAYGLEPSEPFYDRAIRHHGLSPERLQLSSLENASYPPSRFDFITFGAVLEHLYDPSSSIKKALSWLKPGGLIQIEVPSSAWLTNRISNLIYRLQGLDYVANISPMHDPFHLYEFGLESFRRNAQIQGYDIAFFKYIVASTYLPKFLNPLVKPLMRMTNTGMQLEIWLRKGPET